MPVQLKKLFRNLFRLAFAGLLVAGGYLLWQLIDYWRRLLRQPKLLPPSLPADLEYHQKIEAKAQVIAQANLLGGLESRLLPNGRRKLVLCAGRRNFREPWARDFGFASFGLLDLGQVQAVKETLEVFLAFQTADGQFPVKAHSTSVLNRYLHSLFAREQPIYTPLRPKYKTAHNTISLDGNALLVVAFLNYAANAGDEAFAKVHWANLKQAINWAAQHALEADGLLHQAAFADWADSVARRGKVLYPNVVYWKALHDLAIAAARYGFEADAAHFAERAAQLRQSINDHFWRDDLGYFVVSHQFDILSSAGNILAAAWGLASPVQAASILEKLDEFRMSNPVPTQVTHRAYPDQFIALENRLGGIGNYHTGAAWLWLGGWHVIALIRAGRLRRAEEMLYRLSRVIVRDGAVHEVYDPAGQVLSTRWYTSEAPLTWSAGVVAHAFHEYSRAVAELKSTAAKSEGASG
jgi:glycogen debranching enzyme